MTTSSHDPETVVQRRLDAYNGRDIAAVLAAYGDDAEMFEHPSKLLASGSADARLDTIAERLEFLAAIRKGIDQIERDETVPHEEVKRQLAAWLSK